MTGAFDWLNTSPEAFLAQHLPAAARRAGAQRTDVRPVSQPVPVEPDRPLQTPVGQTNHPSTTQKRQGRD